MKRAVVAVAIALVGLAFLTLAAEGALSDNPCKYCKYCRFCKFCPQCPCEYSACEFCPYCRYCRLCSVCSSCEPGGILHAIGSGWQTVLRAVLGSDADEVEGAVEPNERAIELVIERENEIRRRHGNKDEL